MRKGVMMRNFKVSDKYDIESIRKTLANEVSYIYNTVVQESGINSYNPHLDNEELDTLLSILDAINKRTEQLALSNVFIDGGIDVKNQESLNEIYDIAIDYRLLSLSANIGQHVNLGTGELANHFNKNEIKKYFSNANKSNDTGLRLQQFLFNLPYDTESAEAGEIKLFDLETEISVKYDLYTLSYNRGEITLSNEDGLKFTIPAHDRTEEEYKQQLLVVYSLLITGSTAHADDDGNQFNNFLNKLLFANLKEADFPKIVEDTIKKIHDTIVNNVRNVRAKRKEEEANQVTDEGDAE